MSSDQLNVPSPAVSTRRRLSDALLQVVPNFPVSYRSPVSKLAKALGKRVTRDNNAQVGSGGGALGIVTLPYFESEYCL